LPAVFVLFSEESAFHHCEIDLLRFSARLFCALEVNAARVSFHLGEDGEEFAKAFRDLRARGTGGVGRKCRRRSDARDLWEVGNTRRRRLRRLREQRLSRLGQVQHIPRRQAFIEKSEMVDGELHAIRGRDSLVSLSACS